MHFSPPSLFARALSHIMPFIAQCRLVLRAAVWADGGRSVVVSRL